MRYYYITTNLESYELERHIMTIDALVNRTYIYRCANWQEARRRQKEYGENAYKVVYSADQSLAYIIVDKRW